MPNNEKIRYAIKKIDTNEYKKQIEKVSRDGRAKKYTNKMIADEIYPYTVFIETLLLDNKM